MCGLLVQNSSWKASALNKGNTTGKHMRYRCFGACTLSALRDPKLVPRSASRAHLDPLRRGISEDQGPELLKILTVSRFSGVSVRICGRPPLRSRRIQALQTPQKSYHHKPGHDPQLSVTLSTEALQLAVVQGTQDPCKGVQLE